MLILNQSTKLKNKSFCSVYTHLSIKKLVLEWGRKAYNAVKGKITPLKSKIENALKNAKDKVSYL